MSRQSGGEASPIIDESLAAGKPWASVIEKGRRLRIVDVHGQQGVDFLCYNAHGPEERYHAPNTLKAARSLRLTKGHVLYSDVARPMFRITEDTCGTHDTIGGCCSAPSNEMLYGVSDCPGCRENFLAALEPFVLPIRYSWTAVPSRGTTSSCWRRWMRSRSYPTARRSTTPATRASPPRFA